MADDRTYIRVHDGLPGHPKIRGLSDKAFRTMIRAWCYCSEYLTDGEVVAVVARDLGPPRTWDELVKAGIAELGPSGYLMHDYLEHQRSAQEVSEIKAARGAGGQLGNHIRWHVKRRKPDPDCEFCIANRSQDRSVKRSDDESLSDRSRSHRSETETETETETSSYDLGGNATEVDARDPDEPPKCPKHRGLRRAFIADCLGCARKRQAWEASRSADAVFPRDPWCGDDKCDPITRNRGTPFGGIRCPECHPLAEEASTA